MKKNICTLFLLFLLLFSAAASEKLKIMTWNLKNCFDTIDDPDKSDTVVSQKEYEDKITMLSGVIKKYNPDIAGFSEVENITVLKNIATKSNYEYYYLIEGNDPRGIDVGVISNIALEYRSNKDLPVPYKGNSKYKFSRDCTVSSFATESGKKIYILTTHLKSGYMDDGKSEMKRIAQSKGILDIVASIYEKEKIEPFVVINGDLNTERYTEPLNIIEKAGFVIMNYSKSPDKLYTYSYRKEKKNFDYIIINKFFDKSLKNKKIYSVNDDFIKNMSDHYPVIAEFEF